MNNRLLKLELSGFKSIERLSLDLGAVSVLIGANGAGKSNLISLFRMLNALFAGRLQEFVGVGGGGASHLFFGPKTTPQMQCTFTFEGAKGQNRYHIRLAHGAGDKLVYLDEAVAYCAEGRDWETAHTYSLGVGHLESALRRSSSQAQPAKTVATIYGLLGEWLVFQFHDTSASARIKQAVYVGENRFLWPDGGNLAPFLCRMRDTARERYDLIVATIQRVLPSFHDFDLEPYAPAHTVMLNWRHSRDSTLFGPHQLSDGSLRFMCLCALLLQPHLPSLVVLDEPELGLHPFAIELLAGLIRSASADCQVIFSTQSVTLANQFQPSDIVVVNEDDGTSRFEKLQPENLTHWLDEYGVGDLWAKNLLGGTPQ